MAKFRVTVEGMTCGGCVRSIENALKRLDGQAQVEVDLADKTVEVDTGIDLSAVVNCIEDAGFDVVNTTA